ncbi:DUF4365 domain-containing protein [Streptosporangium sp. NPDC001559]|uniref:DUF4365 domain-containing protein n=1 Tax=Streptosporangium sp. NPDC001559 TaxID=3366187 RepID=UPI0036DFB9B7
MTIVVPRTPEDPLRGDLRLKSRMEMLQDSYLRAVAAAAGCTMAKPDPDDGIDWVLSHNSGLHTVDSQIDIKVQLKSTYQYDPNPPNGHVSVKLSNDRLVFMAAEPVIIHRVLVAMIIPKEVAAWVVATHDFLSLRHCAYWAVLTGLKPTGKEETSVKVSTANVFDDIALCAIMKRIGAGGKP